MATGSVAAALFALLLPAAALAQAADPAPPPAAPASSSAATAPAATTAIGTIPPAAPGTVATAAPAGPPPPPGPGIVRVRMTTSDGAILIDLEAARAPLTVANFLRYVDGKRLDNSTIYRVVKPAPGYGFIQGGINNDPKRILPPVAHEPTSRTGLTHGDGTISLPRAAPGSGRGEFFITVGAMPTMDADPKQPGDNLGYAAFGHVVAGMDIVRHMIDEPVSATAGPAAMKGEMLVRPIRILSVRRVP